MTTVEGEPEYFMEMCDRFRTSGKLRILSFQTPDKVIAMEIWVRGGDGFYLLKISYDENYARFGPGVLMQTAAFRFFHDHTDADWIDTCTAADNKLLMRLYPERKKIEMLSIVLGRNLIDRAVVAAFVLLRPLHKRMYRNRKM